jgi:hypothetical protein
MQIANFKFAIEEPDMTAVSAVCNLQFAFCNLHFAISNPPNKKGCRCGIPGVILL